RSKSGSGPRCAGAWAWPGSAERCEAKGAWRESGASVTASSAAEPAMNPSSATGTRRAAPARITPVRPPISNPPTFASTSRPSRGSGRLTSSARRTAATLRVKVASSTPVPRPVTCSAGAPVIAAVIALGAAAREVLDHLGGHDLGVGADTLGDDAVVGGEREDDGSRDFRRAPAQNGEAQRDLLEPTETSGRLGQAIEMAPGGALSVARGR